MNDLVKIAQKFAETAENVEFDLVSAYVNEFLLACMICNSEEREMVEVNRIVRQYKRGMITIDEVRSLVDDAVWGMIREYGWLGYECEFLSELELFKAVDHGIVRFADVMAGLWM